MLRTRARALPSLWRRRRCCCKRGLVPSYALQPSPQTLQALRALKADLLKKTAAAIKNNSKLPPAPQQQPAPAPQQPLAGSVLPSGADTLFGGATLFGVPLGQPRLAGEAGGGSGGLAPAALASDRDLADLALDFGSLLGVADAPPSWLPQNGGGVAGGAQAQAAAPAPLGDRPFAQLFGK